MCLAGSLPGVQVDSGCYHASFCSYLWRAIAIEGSSACPMPGHSQASKLIAHYFEPTKFMSGEKMCVGFLFFAIYIHLLSRDL